jgi:hypothetical protein
VIRPLWISCILLAPAFGQVPDKIDVDLDGKPFTTFHSGVAEGRPYLAPLRSASGKIITRHFPMEMIEGESRDHKHHRGLWFSYDDVNGVKFWENDPSYDDPKTGRIVATKAEWKPASKTLETVFNWNDHSGKTVLVEHRVMTFRSGPSLRIIDFDITLTAPEKVAFGDTKEGAFAIRLADALTEKSGSGKMVDSEGRQGMAAIWGKRASWVDYSGTLDAENLGIAIFDHPSNPGYPVHWHARDYGLFAVNPWGQHAFDPEAAEAHTTLPAKGSLRFRWRVVIHEGDAAGARIAELYKEFAK